MQMVFSIPPLCSLGLYCSDAQVVIIYTYKTCCYDKQQQLKEHQAVRGMGSHHRVVSFGDFEGLKVMPVWLSVVAQVLAQYGVV